MKTINKPTELAMQIAERNYWHAVVSEEMERREDWRYPDEAVKGLLNGTHNQDQLDNILTYPVWRWRQLNEEIEAEIKRDDVTPNRGFVR